MVWDIALYVGWQLCDSVINSYCRRHVGGIYLLQQCYVVSLRILGNCYVWNSTPVEKHGLRITLAYEFSRIPHFYSLFTLCVPPTWRRQWHCTPWQGRTGPPGCLARARWAGRSDGQVGRHVNCWRREWNGGGGPL